MANDPKEAYEEYTKRMCAGASSISGLTGSLSNSDSLGSVYLQQQDINRQYQHYRQEFNTIAIQQAGLLLQQYSRQYLIDTGAIIHRDYPPHVMPALKPTEAAVINTERLKLVILTAVAGTETIDTMVGWLNDPEVVRYSEQRHVTHTRKSQTVYLSKMGVPVHPVKYWLIYQHDKERNILNKLIGSISLDHKQTYRSECLGKFNTVNIGIMLGDKSAQGHGYALEAMTAIINYLADRDYKRFEIGTMKENQPMIRLATSCGMKVEREENGFIYMAAVI